MLITALFSSFGIPLYLGELFLDLITVDVVECSLALFKPSYLHITDIVNVSCIFEYCGNVRSNVGLSVGNADYHRAILTCGIDFSREVLEHDTKSI